MTRSHTAALLACLAAGSLLAGCADPMRSRNLADPTVSAVTLAQQVCANCHGAQCNATSPNFPNLAGQTESYLTGQLRAYKSHDRSDPAGFQYMWGISRSLTDEQILGLAAYYAVQQPTVQPLESSLDRIVAGRLVFENGVPAEAVPACVGCHGSKGMGNIGFPRLAGQHADYIAKQLVVFQRTDERPDGAVMKVVSHGLTRQNIDDVASYLQALKQKR